MTEEEWINRQLAVAPPLSKAQRSLLARLLAGSSGSDG